MKSLIKSIFSAFAFAGCLLAFDHEHQAFTELLSDHVKSKGVNYKDFKKYHPQLKNYLEELSKVAEEEFADWSEDQQLAYLINLYNAATLELVLQYYPIKSFKDEIGGETGPWKYRFVKALGKTYTLDEIEHTLIRGNYKEPRIHFAVNCASEGCPALRDEAFTASKLDEQLEEQTQKFFKDSSKNDFKKGRLHLSPIFDWFKADFIEAKGSVEEFVAPYFPSEKITKGNTPIQYTKYSWKINEQ